MALSPPIRLGAWSLLVADKGGRWSRRAVDKLLLDATLDWQGHVTKQALERAMSAESFVAATKHAVLSATPRGRADTLASIGAVYGLLEQRGLLPDGLTVCEQNQVDGDRFSLGTPNGVLSLDTGELLPADEARRRFVTRSIPDSARSRIVAAARTRPSKRNMGFNGAATREVTDRTKRGCTINESRCFNGAATARSRIGSSTPSCVSQPPTASMGPRPRGHG